MDLAITTDYRSVLGEIFLQKMGLSDIQQIFPGFNNPGKLGFLA